MEAARGDLLPKKRFAFTKKVARVKGSEVAAAAATAAGPTGAGEAVAGASSAQGGGPCRGAMSDNGGRAGAGTDTADDTKITISERDEALIQSGRGLQGLRNQVRSWWWRPGVTHVLRVWDL